jgi:raffinose/stachyose/melibiose transport system substrate-binding protein
MKRVLITVLSAAFFVAVGSLVWATGAQEKKPAEKPRLVVYDYGHAEEPVVVLYKKLVDAYNARPEAKVLLDYQFIPGDAYYPKLNAAIAANAAPDIFSSHAGGVLASYVTAGKVLALDGALSKDPPWKNRFVAGAFDALSVGGKVYAVPTSQAVVPIFYNKEIFARLGLKVPRTYDDLKGVISTLLANGVIPFANGDKDVWVGAMMAEVITNRSGGNAPYAAIAAGGGNWSDPSFAKAGKILQELVSLKAFPDNFLGIGYDAMISLFMGEKAAMCLNGTWDLGRFAAADSPIKDKVGVMNFPAVPGGVGAGSDWLGNPDHNIAISAANKSPEASVDFLKIWASEEVQKNIGEEQGKIIVTKTTLDPKKVPAVANELNVLLQKMTGTFLFYDVGLGPTIGQEYNNTVQAILAGTDPASAFQKLQKFTEDTRAEKK